MRVFWSLLLERSIPAENVMAMFGVALNCANHDYAQIITPYCRTDVARNKLVASFMDASEDDEDVLVMLDCDHIHPMDIVERLVKHNVGVVGALAFRRGAPFDPCFYVRQPDGSLAQPVEWAGLHEGTVVGTGAIAIKRWVFKLLENNGSRFPFFRYEYEDMTLNMPSEDIYFGYICEKAGISHFCDTGLVTPHLITSQVDETSWAEFMKDHEAQLEFTRVATRKDVTA